MMMTLCQGPAPGDTLRQTRPTVAQAPRGLLAGRGSGVVPHLLTMPTRVSIPVSFHPAEPSLMTLTTGSAVRVLGSQADHRTSWTSQWQPCM